MQNMIRFDDLEPNKKKINKKKIIISLVIIAIIATVLILIVAYSSSKPFRKWMDRYIFRKNVSEEKLVSIQLDYDSNISVIAYNKYICVLAENMLRQYNSSAELISEIKLEISNPVYNVNNKYLAISEKNSASVYLISDSKILWQKEVDGKVAKIDVNKNGYVSVILTGTTHKSVIMTFDNKGNELFKTYLSSTTAMDSTISIDNKYLAFAEISTTGTFIQSNIKIVSIEKAKESPSDSIIYTYNAPSNCLVSNIDYKNKNKLVCNFDDGVRIIQDNKDEMIMSFEEEEKKINAADIQLNNCIYRAIEKNAGLFKADTIIEIMNVDSKKETIYTIEGVAKNIYCHENIIAINLGQEIDFINTSGWLIKNYSSSQDIQDIIIGNNLAGIVYRDKVEIINL